jgi:hypothetical protein
MANKVIESPKYLSLVNKQIIYISKYDLAERKGFEPSIPR